MSSKGRQIAKNIGKSLKKKLETDLFQFGVDDQQRDVAFLQAPVNVSPQRSPPLSSKKARKMQSPRTPKKSNSMSTISGPEGSHPGIVDHDEIIALTHDVKKFSDSLARLKALFTDGCDEEDDPRVVTHECLGEVLSVLNPVMQHYPALQSPDIFTAAGSLISMIKGHNYEEDVTPADLHGYCEAIDQLALAFSSSVSEYLMGDMGPQMLMDYKTKSMNNIAGADAAGGDETEDDSSLTLSVKELDSLLVDLDSGLTLSLQRAKAWSKYVHDIISYMEKKAQIEYDFAKNISRLVHSVQNNLKKEGFLPLQSVYCTALAHDEEFVTNLQATQSILHRFIEPLIARRADHDKVYKSVKEAWHREHRRMTDSVTNLRKAQALYHSRQQDHERARELSLKAEGDKLEKRKKAEDDMMHKAAEAETTYKACVAEANYRQQELYKVKHELLSKIREQIEMCDQVIKSVTVEYFQLYQTVVSPLPLQYQTLSESSKGYMPGSQYAEYMRRLPPNSPKVQPQNFMFEPYIHGLKSSPEGVRKASVHSNGSVSDPTHSPDGSPVASPRRDKYRIPVKAWSHGQGGHSDTDSASCSSRSHESSPSGSPHGVSRRHLVTSQSLDELTEEELIAAAAAASAYNGKEKRAGMKRTVTLGGDNTDCLLMGRRNTTFGVDFQEQVNTFQTKVPPIVSKCLVEIERRGLMIKGIYRVSGVKSKVEHLCQRFDIDPEAVSLEDVHPNIISNVLKLYLRQLPEPLLTFKLYSDFIHAAKENMSGQLKDGDLVEHLRRLVKRLPSSNMRTCAVLMHHLQRVAAHSELNQMNASNLGIVFGPTLLRPLEGSASLASLVDTPHQTRAIELLIFHAPSIFGPSEDFQVAPSQTPIEHLNEGQQSLAVLSDGSSSTDKREPKKSPTVDSEDSSVFETSTGPNNATQPAASEYVLPGTASNERNETQYPSSHGLELTLADSRSDEDEELPEIHLPDQSKPQSEPLSVVLSPRCISASTQDSSLGQKGNNTQDRTISSKSSASTPVASKESLASMPNSSSAPVTSASGLKESSLSNVLPSKEVPHLSHPTQTVVSESGKSHLSSPNSSRMHESHSAGDLVSWKEKALSDGGKSSESGELTKKKPHSQKLENIKFLTRAPSFDEVAGIMEELVVKSGSISPNLSARHRQPQRQSNTTATPDTSRKTDTLKSLEPHPVSKLEPLTVPRVPSPLASQRTESAVPDTQKVDQVRPFKGEAVPSFQRTTSHIKALRKSILEEMPVPTVTSQPLNETSESKGDKDKILPVTIPASPTIKRREMPSKIPSSPTSIRSYNVDIRADQDMLGGEVRAGRFRQEQRKLVSAIKTGSRSSSSQSGSSVEATMDNQEKGSTMFSPSLGSSAKQSNILSGGCALLTSYSSESKEQEHSSSKYSHGSEISKRVGDSREAQEMRSTHAGSSTRNQSKTFGTSSTKPASKGQGGMQTSVKPKEAGLEDGSRLKGGKPRAIGLPSTAFVKKEANTTASPSASPSSLSKFSYSDKAPLSKSGSSNPSSLVKQRSFSSSKESSPKMCPRAAAMTKSMEGRASKSGQQALPKTTVKISSKAGEGDYAKGESPSPRSKYAPSTITSGQSPTHVRVRRASGGSGSSPTSSPKRTTRPLQRKSSADDKPAVAAHRLQEKPVMSSAQSQQSISSSVSRSSSQSQSPSLSSLPSAATQSATTAATTVTTSGSGKLSQDRTPRFV